MEYRRRNNRKTVNAANRSSGRKRYPSVSRTARKQPGINALAVLMPILAFAAVAYLLLGTELKDRLSERTGKTIGSISILPAGCGDGKTRNEKDAVTRTETALNVSVSTESPFNTAAETDTLKASLPGVTLNMLQMGVYSSEEYAAQQAGSLKNVGAAGYIYDDKGSYRVIAASYSDNSAAQNVCKRLNDEGYDCTVFPVTCSGADVLITANAEELDIIKHAFDAASSIIKEIEQASIDFDASERSVDYTNGQLSAAANKAVSAARELKAYTDDNDLLMSLYLYLSDVSESINSILSLDISNARAEYSSALKTLEIIVTLRYVTLLRDICY